MNNNVRDLVSDLKDMNYDNGDLNARVGILRNFVDDEDVKSAENNIPYHTPSIDTDTIRKIFNWGMCPRARQIMEKREAEKNNDAGSDGRTEG